MELVGAQPHVQCEPGPVPGVAGETGVRMGCGRCVRARRLRVCAFDFRPSAKNEYARQQKDRRPLHAVDSAVIRIRLICHDVL